MNFTLEELGPQFEHIASSTIGAGVNPTGIPVLDEFIAIFGGALIVFGLIAAVPAFATAWVVSPWAGIRFLKYAFKIGDEPKYPWFLFWGVPLVWLAVSFVLAILGAMVMTGSVVDPVLGKSGVHAFQRVLEYGQGHFNL